MKYAKEHNERGNAHHSKPVHSDTERIRRLEKRVDDLESKVNTLLDIINSDLPEDISYACLKDADG